VGWEEGGVGGGWGGRRVGWLVPAQAFCREEAAKRVGGGRGVEGRSEAPELDVKSLVLCAGVCTSPAGVSASVSASACMREVSANTYGVYDAQRAPPPRSWTWTWGTCTRGGTASWAAHTATIAAGGGGSGGKVRCGARPKAPRCETGRRSREGGGGAGNCQPRRGTRAGPAAVDAHSAQHPARTTSADVTLYLKPTSSTSRVNVLPVPSYVRRYPSRVDLPTLCVRLDSDEML
jgi:hypothetical protein